MRQHKESILDRLIESKAVGVDGREWNECPEVKDA